MADATSSDTAPRCAVCDAPVTGAFCSVCGARRHAPGDASLARFLRDQFHEVTSADGKLWRTLRALFVPGKLTAEFFDGRESLYVRPVRLFLAVNVVLFFLMSGNSGTILKGPLRSNYHAALYGPLAERLARDRAETWGTSLDTVEAAFDTHASGLAPSLLGSMIPAFALLFALVLWPCRASGVRHLVLATHSVSVFLAASLLLIVGLSLALSAARWATGLDADSIDPVLVPTAFLGFTAYLVGSVRRVYGIGWTAAVAAGVGVGLLGTAFAFWVFRLTLFVVTMGTLDAPA